MIRCIPLAAALAALSLARPALSAEAEAAINAGGPAFLHGTLSLPPGEDKRPAVLIIPGSGPTDRNGNSAIPGVTPNTYRLLAEGLADRGIGSLRFDKRGVGASRAAAPPEETLRLDNEVDDAVAWANFLQSQPQVRCVVLLGHSEGALIAAFAARKIKVCGLIEAAGAGRPLADLLAAQLKAKRDAGDLPQEAYDKALEMLGQLKAGHAVSDVPAGYMALFRPSVQPYLMSMLNLDPVAALKTSTPTLILQGDRDLQVDVLDAKLLIWGPKKGALAILPGVNHVLKAAPADRAANIATYADPKLPLGPGVMSAISEFVLKLH